MQAKGAGARAVLPTSPGVKPLLDQRKRLVLDAVIRDYVATAEPVGSRTIARKYELGVSPATIRNEMADLEELGYLEQPHTSAGRVPTDTGYRFFVDWLMESEHPCGRDLDMIHQLMVRKAREIEKLVLQTARILGETTECLSMVIGPEAGATVLQSFNLIPLRGQAALLVLVTGDGFSHNELVEIPEGVSPEELRRISWVLTRYLAGYTLERIGRSLLRDLETELAGYRVLLGQIMEVLHQGSAGGQEPRVFIGGVTNILKQPEFREIEKVQMILSLLEEQNLVRDLLVSREAGDGVVVTIGHENPQREIQDCSVVTACFYLGGRAVGRIGTLGPRRMDYGRVTALVDHVTKALSKVLTDW